MSSLKNPIHPGGNTLDKFETWIRISRNPHAHSKNALHGLQVDLCVDIVIAVSLDYLTPLAWLETAILWMQIALLRRSALKCLAREAWILQQTPIPRYRHLSRRFQAGRFLPERPSMFLHAMQCTRHVMSSHTTSEIGVLCKYSYYRSIGSTISIVDWDRPGYSTLSFFSRIVDLDTPTGKPVDREIDNSCQRDTDRELIVEVCGQLICSAF
jgi:hypothetical protein